MKTSKLYQVRFFPSATSYSVQIGNKLRPRAVALRAAKAMKARYNIKAFVAPVAVAS